MLQNSIKHINLYIITTINIFTRGTQKALLIFDIIKYINRKK
jgi:hypothetical protein